ncbi:Uma2 family endonuclease [Nostoc sp. CHAB 5715]|uniref:Uma2 family endonuclease n=1 Tax=Nostoc sp. CHAB 5715 TaxID=2780400 RepID=UPI001E290184|nr:Uma2 family endonuclease [Nostoc sp. CHAB 5715]MCC5619979.1 Uma2 family endonuclease [Nostoc sp. CHAB 5715]
MTTAQRLTFEQYLEIDDGTENRYELVDGRLIELPPESEPNTSLANYLFLLLVSAGMPFRQVQPHVCELQVPVLEAGDPANRYPDLVILREEHLELTRKRLTITFDVLPPHLVVEVVSPGQSNRDRDYVRKRKQYAARGVLEYWLIDPEEQAIAILQLSEGSYREAGRFTGSTQIKSPELERLGIQLQLTAEQIFDVVK